MNQTPKELGKELRAWRKVDGITQQELAAKSGVPLTAIRRCEQKGDIPLKRYMELIACLGGELTPKRKQTFSEYGIR